MARALNLLLLSNSTNPEQEWLEHAGQAIREFLGTIKGPLLFVPYAAVTFSFEEYAGRAGAKFREFGYTLKSIHEAQDFQAAIEQASGYVVGGGNTWYLVDQLYQTGIMESLRNQVMTGKPYIGWSAGANIACPSLQTTNDMPIVQPAEFATLNLVPFQINPHYLDSNPLEHQGETREQRILEYIHVNPDVYVAGLREGSGLRITSQSIRLLGEKSVRIFKSDRVPTEYYPGDPLNFLLNTLEGK